MQRSVACRSKQLERGADETMLRKMQKGSFAISESQKTVIYQHYLGIERKQVSQPRGHFEKLGSSGLLMGGADDSALNAEGRKQEKRKKKGWLR